MPDLCGWCRKPVATMDLHYAECAERDVCGACCPDCNPAPPVVSEPDPVWAGES